MTDKVFINGRAAVHKGSAGKSIAFPDVCLCPPTPPAGPIPTPLPNTVQAADLAGGASSVLIEGNPSGNRKSFFAKSTGNEPSQPTGGGVITHAVQGKAYFLTSSVNVFFEGEPAVRHMDLLTHNHLGPQPGNTPPTPWLSTMNLPPVPPKTIQKRLKDGNAWLRLTIVDEVGHPHEGRAYRLVLPNDRVITGRLPLSASLSLQGLPEGDAFFSLLPRRRHVTNTVRARRSDCFAKIASDLGLAHWGVLYDANANRELRATRGSPFMLKPGDEIAIPLQEIKPHRCRTNREHRIVIPTLNVDLMLVLKDGPDALANCAYEIAAPGLTRKGRTAEDGLLRESIPASTTDLTVRMTNPKRTFHVMIGTLQPLTTENPDPYAVGQRLANLGFLATSDRSNDMVALVDAIVRFQVSRRLPATGEIDTTTVSALRAAHEGNP